MKEQTIIEAMNRSRKENDELTKRLNKIETFLINEPAFSWFDIFTHTVKFIVVIILAYMFITSVISVTASMMVTELPNFCKMIGYDNI